MAILLAATLTLTPTADAVEAWPEVTPFQDVNTQWDTHKVQEQGEVSVSSPHNPPASPAPGVHRGMGSGDVEQWRSLVSSYFPAGQVDNALCVINSESGGNPNARNPNSTASGLFQIMASVWAAHYGTTYEGLYNPETNTSIAASIYGHSGWEPWSPRTRRNCGL